MVKHNVQDIISGKKNIDWSQGAISVHGFGGDEYSMVYVYQNSSNCKLITMEYLGYVFSGTHNDKVLKDFDLLLNKLRNLVVFTHVTDARTIENISRHYKIVFNQKVPIGYGEGNQYHCVFLSKNTTYLYYTKYLQRIEKMLKSESEKVAIKPLVNTDEVITDFIKKASNDELDKLRSYKQPKRKKDLITKIKER